MSRSLRKIDAQLAYINWQMALGWGPVAARAVDHVVDLADRVERAREDRYLAKRRRRRRRA